MTGQDKGQTCLGCVHRTSRIRGSEPRSWCKKYHASRNDRCLDYITKPKAIAQAMRFVKQLGIK